MSAEEVETVGSSSDGGDAEEKTFLKEGPSLEQSDSVSSSSTVSTAKKEDDDDAAPEKLSPKKNGGADAGVFAQPFLPPSAPPKSTSGGTTTSPSSNSPSKDPSHHRQQQRQEKKERRSEEKQEKYQQILSTLNYHPPQYAAPCADTRYNFEVLKNGTIVDSFKFSSFDRKGYYIIGRVPGCDIVAENPTVSRMHAILQFIQVPKGESTSGEDATDSPQETGLYLFDLKSTHGTFLNKNQLFPQKFYRVHVGHVLKFGSSQRMYIVNGPDFDEEEESDKSVTELLNERLQKDLERKRLEEEEQLKRERAVGGSKLPRENIEVEGIDWGMAEDADEESDLRVNPFAMDYEASELSLDNPKKTLRSWFEREGQDLEFEIREKSAGQYVCRVALPLEGVTDGPVFAESEVKGKKKEAVHDAAMKACQILDSHGILRASNQESRKRKEKKWADEDYYSSDEDTYLDRTGSVEKKRQKRMRLAGKGGDGGDGGVLTYDSLCAKHSELEKEIGELQDKIEKSQKMKARADDGDVDIDDYMNLLKSGVFDVKKLKGRLKVAQEEMGRTKKLMEIAKPAELPAYLQVKVGSKEKEVPAATVSSEVTEDNPSHENKEVVSPPATSSVPQKSPPKPLVGPRKPPSLPSSTAPPEPKRFGLITPADLAAMKKAAQQRPPAEPKSTSAKSSDEEEDDTTALEEHDSSSDDAGEDTAPSTTSVQEDEEVEAAPEFAKPTKKKRQRYRNQQKNKSHPGKPGSSQGYQDDDKYSEWVPPTGQTGDGKTSLNEKLGY